MKVRRAPLVGCVISVHGPIVLARALSVETENSSIPPLLKGVEAGASKPFSLWKRAKGEGKGYPMGAARNPVAGNHKLV